MSDGDALARVIAMIMGLILMTTAIYKSAWFFVDSFEFSEAELTQMTQQLEEHSFESMSFSTEIQDSYGQTLARIGKIKRIYVPIDQISQQTKNAFLAIEDVDFYHHSGISVRGILRAFKTNIAHGSFIEGGSTITQQTVRSLFLSRKKILSRKFKEGIMALALEKKLEKDEILEIYLNKMYFGRGAYGIGAASRTYFRSRPSQLSLTQSAYLAGLLKAPSRYGSRTQIARTRSRLVLRRMLETKMISNKQYRKAIRTPVTVADRRTSLQPAPYFVDSLTFELKRYLPQNTLKKGWVVKSSFDPHHHQKLLELMRRKWVFLKDRSSSKIRFAQEAEIAGLVYDLSHHQILALKGGKRYAHSQFNRSFYTHRPMGKTVILALASLALAKQTQGSSNEQTSLEILRHHVRLKHLFALVSDLEKSGSGSLKDLIIQTGHTPKHDGFDLMLGHELISPLTLARLISALVTTQTPLPRPTTIHHIRYGSHAQQKPKIYYQSDLSSAPSEPKDFTRHSVLAALLQSYGCGLSFSSHDTQNTWSVYLFKNTATVIWLGTERGAISLPNLTPQDQDSYEDLGRSLCPFTAQDHPVAISHNK